MMCSRRRHRQQQYTSNYVHFTIHLGTEGPARLLASRELPPLPSPPKLSVYSWGGRDGMTDNVEWVAECACLTSHLQNWTYTHSSPTQVTSLDYMFGSTVICTIHVTRSPAKITGCVQHLHITGKLCASVQSRKLRLCVGTVWRIKESDSAVIMHTWENINSIQVEGPLTHRPNLSRSILKLSPLIQCSLHIRTLATLAMDFSLVAVATL